MKSKLFILTIIYISLFVACSTSTSITASWVDPEHVAPKDFKKVAVVTVASNQSNKLVVERAFVERLKFLGYDAFETSSFLTPKIVKKENAELIDKLLKERGADAVIILSLLQMKSEIRYVPGTSPYSPGPYYGGYYGYYYRHYNYMSSPGYYEESKSIFLESNFYDLTNGKLLASIQTQTVDPQGIDDLAVSFSETILKKLVTENVLVSQKK